MVEIKQLMLIFFVTFTRDLITNIKLVSKYKNIVLQEETNEDWFYDFEDFSTPQNFNQENNQDIQVCYNQLFFNLATIFLNVIILETCT